MPEISVRNYEILSAFMNFIYTLNLDFTKLSGFMKSPLLRVYVFKCMYYEYCITNSIISKHIMFINILYITIYRLFFLPYYFSSSADSNEVTILLSVWSPAQTSPHVDIPGGVHQVMTEEEVCGHNIGLLPPGVSVPLGHPPGDVIVEYPDSSSEVP